MTSQQPFRLTLHLRLLYGLFTLLASTMLIWGIGSVFAQGVPDAPWAVYLVNDQDAQIRQFNADGSVLMHQLPESADGLSREIAFSPDETRIAYCLTTPAPADQEVTTGFADYRVSIWDLTAQTTLAEVSLGRGSGCSVTPAAYSVDGSRLAVGLVAPSPTLTDKREGETTWTLYLLDAVRGDTLATLDSLHPQLAELGVDVTELFLIPAVRHVEGDQVTFALVSRFNGQDRSDYPVFLWDGGTGSVTEAQMWGPPLATAIQTADGFEFVDNVWIGDVPSADPGALIPASNAVIVQREGGEPVTVYTNTEEVITSVHYINAGTALAIGLMEAVDFLAGDDPYEIYRPLRYVMLSRDGTVTALTETVADGLDSIRGVHGGYIRYTRFFDPDDRIPAVTLTANIGDETTTLWADDQIHSQWFLLHTTQPDLSGVSLPEFTPAF